MPNLLKRLELNGFKSFAQKTVLEFPDGITAIVGPNGSGKSNVIDAIRWLLGEREARSLRGAKVEDLIFAGTPKKPRLGQAQASLHFNNGSSFFPVEFAEVSVLRQVNREGVSRYFLNKSEVRLKDIVDFFARARLGTKGLVVVTQGNSDMFVQVTPAQRREMIEEALGLREYQIKKIDAERQLKNAEINLEKVRALLEEILPHLRSLKRQTHRWEKRATVEEELKLLEDQFFGSQFSILRGEISGAQREIDEHKKGLEALESDRGKAEAHIKEVEAMQPKERKELSEIKRNIQELHERRSMLQKEIGRLEAQIEMAKETETPVASAAPDLSNLLKKIKAELEGNLEKDLEELRRAVKGLLQEIDEIFSGGKSKSERKLPEALQKSFERINADLSALEKETSELKEKEKSLEKNQEEFYHSFKAATGDLQHARDRIEKWENENRERRFKKERFELRLQELERQIMQGGRHLAEFEHYGGKKDFTESEISALERQILKRRGDLASIGDIDEALMKEARETEERYSFLERELKDLEKAKGDLKELIADLSAKITTEFTESMKSINEEFNKFFHIMFGGGHAKLKIRSHAPKKKAKKEDDLDAESGAPKDISEAIPEEEEKEEEGVDVELSLPRKRAHSLEMLSGGERSLVGIAALFALISVSPPPFLVLDEIDAALDERNARRFAEMIKEFSRKIQFVIVTHNRVTMEAADILYGVTMNDDGTSKVLSLKFGEGVKS